MPEQRDFWREGYAQAYEGVTEFRTKMSLDKIIVDTIRREIPAGETIIDLGCGPARCLRSLSKEYHCIGIDASPEMIGEIDDQGTEILCADMTERHQVSAIVAEHGQARALIAENSWYATTTSCPSYTGPYPREYALRQRQRAVESMAIALQTGGLLIVAEPLVPPKDLGIAGILEFVREELKASRRLGLSQFTAISSLLSKRAMAILRQNKELRKRVHLFSTAEEGAHALAQQGYFTVETTIPDPYLPGTVMYLARRTDKPVELPVQTEEQLEHLPLLTKEAEREQPLWDTCRDAIETLNATQGQDGCTFELHDDADPAFRRECAELEMAAYQRSVADIAAFTEGERMFDHQYRGSPDHGAIAYIAIRREGRLIAFFSIFQNRRFIFKQSLDAVLGAGNTDLQTTPVFVVSKVAAHPDRSTLRTLAQGQQHRLALGVVLTKLASVSPTGIMMETLAQPTTVNMIQEDNMRIFSRYHRVLDLPVAESGRHIVLLYYPNLGEAAVQHVVDTVSEQVMARRQRHNTQ